jgi:hypothetical protein
MGTLARNHQSSSISIQSNAELSKQVEVALQDVLYARSRYEQHSHRPTKT